MTALGELALWVALFLAVAGSALCFAAGATQRTDLAESGRRSLLATALTLAIACGGILAALLRHDFSLVYVASHTTRNTPTGYLLTAFWGGPAGGLLFYGLALSLFGAAAIGPARPRRGDFVPWLGGATAAVLALVLSAVCFVTNPYDRVEWVPAEGRGLAPHLQSAWAAPYFLATYGGYAAAAMAFAVTVAAAVTRAAGAEWLLAVRRWALASWALLAVSGAVGMRWSYLEPQAGGLLRWDLGSGARALAWLFGFALVAAFIGRRGRRSVAPRVVAALALATFGLTLLSVAAVPPPPGAPAASGAGTSRAGGWVLAAFLVVAAGAVYPAVARIPRTRADVPAVALRRPSIGAYTIYAGASLLAAGLAAQQSWTAITIRLGPGEAREATDPYGDRWRFVSQGVSRDERVNYLATGAALEAWRGGTNAGIVSAERRQYLDSGQRPTGEPATEPGLRSFPALDLYVVLSEVRREIAELRIGFRPLVAAVWIGWVLILAGASLLAVESERAPPSVRPADPAAAG